MRYELPICAGPGDCSELQDFSSALSAIDQSLEVPRMRVSDVRFLLTLSLIQAAVVGEGLYIKVCSVQSDANLLSALTTSMIADNDFAETARKRLASCTVSLSARVYRSAHVLFLVAALG